MKNKKVIKSLVAMIMTVVMLVVIGMTEVSVKAQYSATENGVEGNGLGVPSITYAVHSQSYGWMAPVSDGKKAGTSGESKRLEAICISINSNGAVDETGNPLSGGIMYRTHVQGIGWQEWVSSNMDENTVTNQIDSYNYAGTMGQSKRLESIEIKLTGDIANYYDVIYRTHVQGNGWLNISSNGASSGTTGQSKRLEAIEIMLVKKEQVKSASLSYCVHGQTYGWTREITPEIGAVNDQTIAGTVGQSKRVEALSVKLDTEGITGGVEYSAHVQGIGWTSVKNNGAIVGSEGQGKRLEAITVKLTGMAEAYYDIYYRTHVQGFGWLDWAKNGQQAGSEGYGKRVEAIQMVLIPKGGAAPGETAKPFSKYTKVDWRDLPGELSIKINKQMNCVTIYKGDTPIKAMICSTGAVTPLGTYSVKTKWRWHELMGGVYGQYCTHITGEILFHSVPYRSMNIYDLYPDKYNKLGTQASAGCVRLTVADAKWIYDNCPWGTPVIIYNSPDPGPLGKPTAEILPLSQTWDPTDPAIK